MDIKYILPFLEALKGVLEQFGAVDIRRGDMARNDLMYVDTDITAVGGYGRSGKGKYRLFHGGGYG